ncbi:hypothetical protein [Euzebyella marina]|nr:hypothetical protein [Euzebyella marina]
MESPNRSVGAFWVNGVLWSTYYATRPDSYREEGKVMCAEWDFKTYF